MKVLSHRVSCVLERCLGSVGCIVLPNLIYTGSADAVEEMNVSLKWNLVMSKWRRCLCFTCKVEEWSGACLSNTGKMVCRWLETHTLFLSLSLSLSLSLYFTQAHIHTHTHTLSLSLSLSLTHTHTHTQGDRQRERERERETLSLPFSHHTYTLAHTQYKEHTHTHTHISEYHWLKKADGTCPINYGLATGCLLSLIAMDVRWVEGFEGCSAPIDLKSIPPSIFYDSA